MIQKQIAFLGSGGSLHLTKEDAALSLLEDIAEMDDDKTMVENLIEHRKEVIAILQSIDVPEGTEK